MLSMGVMFLMPPVRPSTGTATALARIAPHQAPEVHAHLCAAFPDAAFGVESHGDPHRDPIWHGMYRQRAQIKDSYTYLNDEPGFGIEIDWKFIEQHKP